MRILVVEDDPILLRSLAETLRDENYAVDMASDGEEGLYKGSQGFYDLIVLDVMMPKLDGWQVLDRLRRINQTPVLMLTALDATSDRVKGLDTGADDYLAKPFDTDELLARIRALIRRSSGSASNELRIGPLALNTGSRTVTVDGDPVELTAREYGLLEYLVVRKDCVVTRTELYDHLFDEEDSTLSNLLDVHVYNLRRKVGKDLIKTRRGHGYCIESDS